MRNSMALALFCVTSVCCAQVASATEPLPTTVNQGKKWSAASRDEFYSLDQGSRIMPLRWMQALKLPDGSLFMSDSLGRYGFLPNNSSPARLPVGFTAAGQPGNEAIGMTCAACHTRQIQVGPKTYRIDGGPAFIDFQAFVSDLDTAVDYLLNNEKAFVDFRDNILGGAAGPEEQAKLRQAVADWHFRYHTLMEIALPKDKPWGPGRVDAIGMIFNRLTGLDLGPPPSHIIKENIRIADAPTRYPFLWNVHKESFTQWPGFQPNTDPVFRLGRNIGQVLGVFADFLPSKNSADGSIDFWAVNSINVNNLNRLEVLMTEIGAPRWPWALDEKLAARGRKIYKEHCNGCHAAAPTGKSWKTPVKDVNTDSRELALLNRRAKTGVLQDVGLEEEDTALRVLTEAVIRILLSLPQPFVSERETAKSKEVEFRAGIRKEPPGYEARVLHGVWAAAPYLHNGSVPTLADLLKPAAERRGFFKIGPAYDPVAVGLAAEQPGTTTTLTTTDCSDRGSGNSRCGHEYGTKLKPRDKRALLEYLKKL